MADVVIFSKAEFEAALPRHNQTAIPLWHEISPKDGEFVYVVQIDSEVGIEVRSSVKTTTGKSAGTGKDSIRAWLIDLKTGRSLGKKVSKWTTRLPGWEKRLVTNPDSVIRTLWTWRKRAGDCPECLEHLKVNKVKDTEKNQAKGNVGRPYASCWNKKCDNGPFRWLDIQMETPPFFRPAQEVEPTPVEEPNNGKFGFMDALNLNSDEGQPLLVEPPTDAILPEPPVIIVGPRDGNFTYGDVTPNVEQKEAITAPIDKSVRVIAPAGAGKTRVIALRYSWYLHHGIDPKNILAVTFTRTMAQELYERIAQENPQIVGGVAAQQICTIHAICLRLLRWSNSDDTRQVAPDWEQKRAITDLAEKIWEVIDIRPGWAEILSWINTAKAYGFTSRDDYRFFTEFCGGEHGPRLSTCRQRFDEVMRKGGQKGEDTGYITFPDMLLEVEEKLRSDSNFRMRWQSIFGYLIIDEFQDTSFQALRILLTLSFSPGSNDIYKRWKPGEKSLITPTIAAFG